VCQCLFALSANHRRQHRPDVAYVSHERWPKDRPWPDTDPWPVVPEIAGEVISPNDLAATIMQKVKDYLAAGVKLVWVVYPEQGWLHVFEAPDRLRGLTVADTLEAPSVLPGFSLPLAELFTRPASPGENGDAETPAV
jgi:Uma2 family endonuclease